MASTRETVVAAIIAQFQGMAAAGLYVHPPDVVEGVLVDDESYLDESKTTVYLVQPGPERIRLKTNSESQSAMEIRVVAATRHTVTPQEFPAGQTGRAQWQKENDLIADVVQCVSRDPRFGGVAVGTMEQPFDIRYGYMAKWAVVEVGFTVDYRFSTGGR